MGGLLNIDITNLPIFGSQLNEANVFNKNDAFFLLIANVSNFSKHIIDGDSKNRRNRGNM